MQVSRLPITSNVIIKGRAVEFHLACRDELKIQSRSHAKRKRVDKSVSITAKFEVRWGSLFILAFTDESPDLWQQQAQPLFFLHSPVNVMYY